MKPELKHNLKTAIIDSGFQRPGLCGCFLIFMSFEGVFGPFSNINSKVF